MMESLPIDTNHPAVRDYLSLIRLQVLTPLSLLINIATITVCTAIVKPSLNEITTLHPTSISPKPALIAIYVLAIWLGQIGYCLLLVVAKKPETKQAMIKGVGLPLVFANWVMAGWAISWVFQMFLVSTILLGLLTLLLLYSNIVLLIYHRPAGSRPLDTALIHAPLRAFLILPLSLMFPYSLFVTLGMSYRPPPGGNPGDYAEHPWPGFAVVMITNLIGMIVIMVRRDVVWCAAATWICVSTWSARPKPLPVYAAVIAFTVLHPLALIGSFVYSKLWPRDTSGQIVLDGDEGVPNSVNRNGAPQPARTRGPQEIDAEELWG